MDMKTTDVSPGLLDWLLAGDPAIRWQTLRDVTGADAAVVAHERARVAAEGWGAALLAMQDADGWWPAAPPIDTRWRSTMDALLLLREFGAEASAPGVRGAVDRVHTQCTWGEEFGNSPFFEGEVEPCINGRVLALGAYFGRPSNTLLERLLAEQLADGGWNCRAPQSQRSSFHTTICVLEGLLEYEQAKGPRPEVTSARRRAQEYLLERGLFRARSTGRVIDPEWTCPAFPNDWHYDILWGLDYLFRAGSLPDARAAEAVAMVRAKREPEGWWTLERAHEMDIPLVLEGGVGQPSRWLTLRALRGMRTPGP